MTTKQDVLTNVDVLITMNKCPYGYVSDELNFSHEKNGIYARVVRTL